MTDNNDKPKSKSRTWVSRILIGIELLGILFMLVLWLDLISLPGIFNSLEAHQPIILGIILGIIWLIQVSLKVKNPSKKISVLKRLCLWIFPIAVLLCIVMNMMRPSLVEARFELSRNALEQAAKNPEAFRGKKWIGLYRTSPERVGNVVEFWIEDAGLFVVTYYFLYAPDGVEAYRKLRTSCDNPEPLGKNWYLTADQG